MTEDEQRDAQMQHLVAEVFDLAGALRRDGEAIAKRAGQTQARWQVMWIAATGQLTVAMIARRLGLTRQSVQRVADMLVDEGLATYDRNPDHQRSPLLTLTPTGHQTLEAINQHGRERNLQQAASLTDDGVATLRQLLRQYREALRP